MEKPFDFYEYEKNPTAWKLIMNNGVEVKDVKLRNEKLRHDHSAYYILEGYYINKPGQKSKQYWGYDGNYFRDSPENALSIVKMIKVEKEPKVQKVLDIPPMLINMYKNIKTNHYSFSGHFNNYKDAESNKEYYEDNIPDYKYIGTISMDQHPQVVELLLIEGEKLKS